MSVRTTTLPKTYHDAVIRWRETFLHDYDLLMESWEKFFPTEPRFELCAYRQMGMCTEIESGARYLATASVDAISYGCTTGSFFKGPGWDREMIALIERTAKVPAVATRTASSTPYHAPGPARATRTAGSWAAP